MSSAATRTSEMLWSLGYEPGHLRTDFPVLTERGPEMADLVAFGRVNGPHDASTATLLVEYKTFEARRGPLEAASLEALRQMAFALSAPAIVVAASRGWSVYGVGDDLTLIDSLAWSTEPGRLREMLSPRALLEAKLGHRQLSLFPAAPLVSARGRQLRERALAPRVAEALDATASATLEFHRASDRTAIHARAARLVIGALTTVVLRDKDEPEAARALRAGSLLDRALQRYPHQFSWVASLPDTEQQLLDGLIDAFADLDYTSVEPELLSQLYEQRLVDDASRRRLGTHYTPPGLARRLLAWIPIEEIFPSQRVVSDPTCGSGSLLIAAHDRLRDLEPEHLSPEDRHAALVPRILGADLDPVAVAIADLALFLNALPAGNGWSIEKQDSLDSRFPEGTNIVVANPPWSYRNVEEQNDQAQYFLDRFITHIPPGGLLGVVLPVGWLTRRSPAARNSRQRVREALELLEVWRLPEGAFASASMGAAVLIARKPRSPKRGQPFVIRRISGRARLQRFFDHGENTGFISRDTSADTLLGGPLHTWYLQTEHRGDYRVGSYAIAIIGPQPEAPVKLNVKDTHRRPNVSLIDWRTTGAFAEAHSSSQRLVHFPDDMQGGSKRGRLMLDRRKIFVSGLMNPERPWRIKVALDDVGDLLARNTVTAVIPQQWDDEGGQAGEQELDENGILYGLFAFLGSGFASAWLDETVSTKYLSTDDLLAIPAPDPDTLAKLADIGRWLLEVGPEPRAIDALEQQVWLWTQAPKSVQMAVIDRLNDRPAPEGRLRYRLHEEASPPVGDYPVPRIRAGAVLAVHEQEVTIAVPGRTPDSGVTLPLPPRFPGALLHPYAAFTVLDDGGPLSSLTYRLDPVAYLDDQQVAELLSDPASASDVGR